MTLSIPFAYLSAILYLSACYSTAGKLTGFDIVGPPGERLELKAKLERDGPAFLNPDAAGKDLEFLDCGALAAGPGGGVAVPFPEAIPEGAKVLGEARTDREGFARLAIQGPKESGIHLYGVRLKDPRSYRLPRPMAAVLASIIGPAQQVLITDIDDTLLPTKIGPLLDDATEKQPPFPRASEILREASGRYRVIYLTARSTYLADRTRHWLSAHRFPAGPILLRDIHAEYSDWNFNEGEFKRRVCENLKSAAHLTEIRWGIGNTEGDAEAYSRSGIHSLILGTEPSRLPKEAKAPISAARSWEEIGALILAGGR